MKSAISAIAMATALLSVASTATAQTDPFATVDEIRNGLYVGGSLGMTDANGFCAGATGACDDSDTGWKIFGGYEFNENLAVEGGYTSLGDMSNMGAGSRSDISGFNVAAVGKLPINEQIGVFGKAGLFRWSADNTTDGDRSGTDLMYGVGAEYKMTDNISVRGEWEKFLDIETSATTNSDVSMFSAGFTYNTL
jgi:OOP family OmpA-OmpF porin